ncbi:MAG TPA: sulfur carrier protein ThiS adenylyltransferase ThiF [Elusimicrobiales bacterium]|nr:sulfur carrier protein ThiS adenylyltransferase ThiF [Elusimicrobiales bacterium]
MKIRLNEAVAQAAYGTTLGQLRRAKKPAADVIIYNGVVMRPAEASRCVLKAGDRVALIKRGEKPSAAKMRRLLCARNTPGVTERLRKTVIGIAGAGGLGSNAAMALARSGVGRLIVADFDVVEPSNLNRQVYSVSQIGMRKVLALKENIRAANPYVRVDAVKIRLNKENAARVFAKADILLEAFDDRDAKAMLAAAFCCRFPKRPLILASGLAACADSNSIRTRRLSPYVYVVGDMITGAAPGVGLMAPRVGIAACHQANLALRLALKLEK